MSEHTSEHLSVKVTAEKPKRCPVCKSKRVRSAGQRFQCLGCGYKNDGEKRR